jgi:hypothetical protein
MFFVLPNLEKFVDSIDYEKVNSTTNVVNIDKNPCSKQCCNHVQWPIPFNTQNPYINKEKLKDYIPSNLTCNGGNGGGCVCLTQSDFNYLSNHGQK